jgi:hypothetical protein
MTVPRATRCADGHFRRVIYGLGPYIADYPEQALLACIVQNWRPRCVFLSSFISIQAQVCISCLAHAADLDRPSVNRSHEHTDALMEGCTLKELWDDFGIVGDLIVSPKSFLHRQDSSIPKPFTTGFPRADIHELISMDLLHQIIKGTFKDHVVDWVETYIRNNNEKAEADRILADIDRRYGLVLPSAPYTNHTQNCCDSTVPRASSLSYWERVQAVDWKRLKGSHEGTHYLRGLEKYLTNFHLGVLASHCRPCTLYGCPSRRRYH